MPEAQVGSGVGVVRTTICRVSWAKENDAVLRREE